MRFGTAAQKERFLPPMARGDVLWTQGFSEPGAGSDLAALTTRAEERGDHFVIRGQKVWNSYADAPADWCFLLARTGAPADRHRRLSVFLLDMRTPGVTVRPIDSMAGPHELNEIFLDDVVVPADCLLGGRDHGWEVVTTGLAFERVGIARYARAGRLVELLVEHARAAQAGGGARLADDPAVRAALADLRVRYEAARLLSYRAISRQAAGADARVEASIARLHNAELEQRAAQVGLDVLGLAGQLTHDDAHAPLGGILWRQWVRTIPTTITAGTTEIQKNVVAEHGLGLPRPR
jgi:alkylation response protein AidB-like acyl-CoA dehydrogenase